MNHKNIFIIFFVFIIFLFSCLSGCIFDDWFSGESTTSFTLNNWSIIDDLGVTGIDISFSCSDFVSLKLFNPDGLQVDSNYFFKGDNKDTILHLSSYGEQVSSGTYKLKVYDGSNNLINEKGFVIEDSYLSIFSCDQRWWNHGINDYILVGLNIMVNNEGSTHIYPYEVEVEMDDSVYSGSVLPVVVDPGASSQLDCLVYKNGIPNNESFTVTIKDVYGNILAYDTLSVNLNHVLTSKSFKKKNKNGNYHISVPYVDFLFDYYDGLSRIQNEDYCLYIFDPFDDPYLDLFTDLLMAEYIGFDDVDKINFAASLVQSLEYKKDSLTDDSYEYPRYPVETLFNNVLGGGDCEDKAILAACVLDNLGFNTALIRLPDHMAVGVDLNGERLSQYDYFVDAYYYLETTTEGKPVGFIPSEYTSATEIDVFSVSSRPLLIHNWVDSSITIYTDTSMGDFVKVEAIVENLGRITASTVTVECAFFSVADNKYNAKTTRIYQLEPYTKEKISLKSDIPGDVTTWFKTRIYFNGELFDEKESANSFPT